MPMVFNSSFPILNIPSCLDYLSRLNSVFTSDLKQDLQWHIGAKEKAADFWFQNKSQWIVKENIISRIFLFLFYFFSNFEFEIQLLISYTHILYGLFAVIVQKNSLVISWQLAFLTSNIDLYVLGFCRLQFSMIFSTYVLVWAMNFLVALKLT